MKRYHKNAMNIIIFSIGVILSCFFFIDLTYADPLTTNPDTVYFEVLSQPRMSPDGDTFYVDSIGRDIKINVNLKNETDAIVSFVFPLFDRCYDGSSFLDPAKNNGSTSPKCFVGSRVEHWGVRAINIEVYPEIMLAATAMMALHLPPGDGPVATLVFTAYDSGAICLDTCFYAMAPPITIADTFSNGYTPVFFKETYQLRLCPYNPGDLNWDDIVDILDVPYIVYYLFKGWDAPCPIKAADANCDQQVTITDAVYLVNYLFRSGPAPQICDY